MLIFFNLNSIMKHNEQKQTNTKIIMRMIDLYAVAISKGQHDVAMAYRHSLSTIVSNMQERILNTEHVAGIGPVKETTKVNNFKRLISIKLNSSFLKRLKRN